MSLGVEPEPEPETSSEPIFSTKRASGSVLQEKAVRYAGWWPQSPAIQRQEGGVVVKPLLQQCSELRKVALKPSHPLSILYLFRAQQCFPIAISLSPWYSLQAWPWGHSYFLFLPMSRFILVLHLHYSSLHETNPCLKSEIPSALRQQNANLFQYLLAVFAVLATPWGEVRCQMRIIGAALCVFFSSLATGKSTLLIFSKDHSCVSFLLHCLCPYRY